MKKSVVAGGVFLTLFVAGQIFAGTFNSFCKYMPFFRDNLTVKADVGNGQLRIDKEGSFRVYLYNTMTLPFYDAKLDVISEQFEAEVVPAPDWKTFPDVESASKGGTRQHFNVTLKRKSGVADGQYDIVLKLYSSRAKFRRLAAVVPLTEALDQQTVPCRTPMTMDAKVLPQEWAGSLLLKDFMSYKLDGHSLKSYSPAAQTRVHMTADNDNLCLLVMLMEAGREDELKMYFTPDFDSKPRVLTLDAVTGKTSADPSMEGVQCVRCPEDTPGGNDVVIYKIRIPRKSLGIEKSQGFYANFCRTMLPSGEDQKPESSYWRGNEVSVREPVVYGKMVFAAQK